MMPCRSITVSVTSGEYERRFEGDGHHNFIDALKRQEFVAGYADLSSTFAKGGQTVEFRKGDKLITEGGEDDHIYLLLAGSVAIMVKSNNVAARKAGRTVGEMAATEPAQKRSATVAAHDTVVTAKLSGAKIMSLGHCTPTDLVANGPRAFGQAAPAE
jgi:CRP/FNR family cyclic AMP-dependent transcriptional regulator